MLIPTLETDRLFLEPPSEAGWPSYLAFYTDAGASNMYGGPMTVRQAWARLASDLGTWHLQGFGVWLLRDKQSDQYIGTCGFWQGKGWPRELTWWVLPGSRGNGFAREASLAAIAHGYDIFGWPAVQTYVKDENGAARALVLALGGFEVARQEFPDGLTRTIFQFPKVQPTAP